MAAIKVYSDFNDNDYLTHMDWGSHTYIADEPEKAGGMNKGPTPIEYLLMSLASCTVITLRMYANRKKFDLKNIEVNIDSQAGSAKEKRKIQMQINVSGKLEEDQRKRMEEISHRCPVHKLLQDSTEINTTLKVQ